MSRKTMETLWALVKPGEEERFADLSKCIQEDEAALAEALRNTRTQPKETPSEGLAEALAFIDELHGRVDYGDYTRLHDFVSALSKRLAETEAIAKKALEDAPADADEMRRLAAQVVELSQQNKKLEKVAKIAKEIGDSHQNDQSIHPQSVYAFELKAALAALSAKPQEGDPT